MYTFSLALDLIDRLLVKQGRYAWVWPRLGATQAGLSRSMPRVLIHRFPRQVWKCSFTLLAQSVGSTNGLLADKERESVARLRVGAIALWKSAPPSGTTTR